MKNSVEMRAGYGKVSGTLGEMPVRIVLILHCNTYGLVYGRSGLRRAVNDGNDQLAKDLHALEQIRVRADRVSFQLQLERAEQFGRVRNVADAVNVSVLQVRRTLRRGEIPKVSHEALDPASKKAIVKTDWAP